MEFVAPIHPSFTEDDYIRELEDGDFEPYLLKHKEVEVDVTGYLPAVNQLINGLASFNQPREW